MTRGAATLLSRDELQGVVAHEFSHILNGDMRLNLRLLGWTFGLLAIAIVARIVMQSAPRASSRDRRDGAGALMLAALAVMVLGYIGVFFGRLLQAAVSRHRERLADASAVQFTRNPGGLSGALLKIAGVSSGSRLQAPRPRKSRTCCLPPACRACSRLILHSKSGSRRSTRRSAPANLPTRAAEAARAAMRLRQADATQTGASARPAAAAGAFPRGAARALASDAAAIAAQAGTIATEQVRYAERARASIPEGVREFVDSADHARALTLALLVSKVPEVLDAQRRVLEEAWGAEFSAHVLAQRATADALAPALRLPAVQQLFPSLRRLSLGERQKLRDVVGRLALADARIDVFECCLTLLLASSLYDSLEAGAQHGSASLLQEVDAIHVLFCVLAAQGTGDAALAGRAYEAGISVVLPEHRPAFRDIEQWPTALRDALARLVHLRPFAKKVLIEGMVRSIAHDRTLSVAEGELLRTVCAVLHCPLPPILGQAE